MKNKLKLAVVGTGLAVVSAAGVGTAFASGSAPSTPAAAVQSAVETPSAVDAPGGPDVQQGDQTSPDTAAAGSEKAGAESPEAAGTEKGSVSDGPGGFADPAGSNANTQQEGEH